MDPTPRTARNVPGKPVYPDGVVPIYLRVDYQKLFHVIIGEDVTKQDPVVMIPTAEILNDVDNVVSDFHPLRDQIRNYDGGDQMLLLYNEDEEEENMDHNFLLCVTKDAMNVMLKRGDAKTVSSSTSTHHTEITKKKFISVAPGESEATISDANVVLNRPLLKLGMSRARRYFGEPYKFGDREAHDGLVECRPFKDPNYVLARQELDVGIQAVSTVTSIAVQTDWHPPANKGVQYEPQTMDPARQTALLTSDAMAAFMSRVRPQTEHALQQNEAVNLYVDDFQALAEDEAGVGRESEAALREGQPYTDQALVKQRKVSSLDWQPDRKGIVAVALAEQWSFDAWTDVSNQNLPPSLVLVWSAAHPITPQMVLESPTDVMVVRFCPTAPHIVVGGTQSGQVILWDLRDATDPLKRAARTEARPTDLGKLVEDSEGPIYIQHRVLSSIDSSHKRPVADLVWVAKEYELSNQGVVQTNPDEQAHQFVTVAPDGLALFWDLANVPKEIVLTTAREKPWKPYHVVYLSRADQTLDYGPMQVVLDYKGNRVIATTEEGELVFADMHSYERGERKRAVQRSSPAHFGPCTALSRSPFFDDVILTVGDWSFNVWRLDSEYPLLTSPCSQNGRLTCGRWSPSRPGVFYIARSDGALEVWDLLDRSHAPSRTQVVSSNATMTCMEFVVQTERKKQKQMLAVGDASGTFQIIEMPRSLSRPMPNEKAFLEGLFAREYARLTFMASRRAARPVEVRKAKAAPAAPEVKPAAAPVEGEQTPEENARTAAERAQEQEDKAAERLYEEFKATFTADMQKGVAL